MQQKYIIILLLFLSRNLNGQDSYPRFTMLPADIQAVIKNAIPTKIDRPTALPADISFVVADIKYKDGALKFCECGDGIYMSLRTAEVELNGRKQNVVAPYWGIFWNYLKQFNLPIWYVGADGPTNALALQELEKNGGKAVGSLQDLERDPLFKLLSSQNFKKTNAIANHKGIIVFRAKTEQTRDGYVFEKFQHDYPQFLFVNAIAREHVKRKDNTHVLFAKAHLDDFIPQHRIVPADYDPSIAKNILNQLDSTLFIIKPVFNSLSHGVNAVARENLDDVLNLILCDKKNIISDHRSLSFWKKSKSAAVVCQYAPSKVIIKNNKPYDPTMRIVFMLHQDKNTVTTTIIAGFWKIPVKSLLDDASLTEKHITIAHAGAYYSGIFVENQDWKQIKDILHTILPQLYVTMLSKPYKKQAQI